MAERGFLANAHTNADLRRAARRAGATAAPNSAVLRDRGRRLRT
jgi:hypothetical protein